MEIEFDPIRDGELISAHLDNELNASQTSYVESILAASVDARKCYDEMVQIRSAYHTWEPRVQGVYMAQRVQSAIHAGEKAHFYAQSRNFGMQRFAVAALLFLTLSGIAWVSHLRKEYPPIVGIEAFLTGFLDRDVEQVVALTDTEISRDTILDIVLTDNVR